MTFIRLSAIIALVLGSSIARAAITRRVTCASGHVTANAACCAFSPAVYILQDQLTELNFTPMEELTIFSPDAQNTRELIDCSDVVPVPKPFAGPIMFPASFSNKDLQLACKALRFPTFATVAGPAPTVAPVPGS